MSAVMEEETKQWAAGRKTALVVEIIQGKTAVAEVSRQFDLTPTEAVGWVDYGQVRMENACRAFPRWRAPWAPELLLRRGAALQDSARFQRVAR